MNIETLPKAATDLIASFPLSTTQTRCWFLDQMQPGNPALNVAVRWELRGKVQADHLERAFQTVINRHEILRTRFVEVDGTPEQQVVETVAFKLDRVDLRRLPDADQAARVENIAHEIAARPFDLGKAGLIRANLVWLASDRALIIFVVHQSCFDGYSIRILGREIGAATQAFAQGQQPVLPELPLQYGDFSLWQEDYLASGVLEEESAYWLKTLDNLSYFEVPPDKPRPYIKSTDVHAVALELPAEFGTRLEQTAQRMGVSPFTFGAAIFSAVLGRLTGSRDVLFGTQIAGRLDTDLEALIGVFINNIVLRFATDPQASVLDHVALTKTVIEGALSHQSMPFNTLVERLNPPRDPSRTPLISVNFNLQSVFMESTTYDDFDLRSSPSHAPGAIYDLDLAVMSRPTGWQLTLEYAVSLFEAQTAQAILDMVAQAFNFALENSDAPLSSLPLPDYLATRGADDRKAILAAEEALLSHPMVVDATVVPSGGGYYGFVVPGKTETLPLEQLPHRIMDRIAEMETPIVSGVSILGALPRTATGDVNKSILVVPTVKPAQTRSQARADVVADLKTDWADILAVPDVSSDAHFFDLGGHSVLVLRQLARIRDRWDVQLDVTALYENPILVDLARLVTARLDDTTLPTAEKDWRFMMLGAMGDAAPLIAINNAATGLALTTAGTEPRPVSCARVVEGDKGLKLDGQSFTEVAQAYAEVIRKGQSDGPYLLYGNCVHGNLALETARILQAEGAEVSGVVMKDVWEPVYTSDLLADPKLKRAEKIFTLKTRFKAVRAGEMSWYMFMRFYSVFRKTGVLKMGVKFGLIKPDQTSDLNDEQQSFVTYVSDQRNVYRPDPITFPVLHIVTDITPQGDGFLPSIGWENVVQADQLKTVHLDKVMVAGSTRIGVDKMASEIETFLAER